MQQASDCQRCPELEHELAEAQSAWRMTEKMLGAAAEDWPKAQHRLAAQRTWIEKAPHLDGCRLRYGLKGATCSCGRDDLLKPPAGGSETAAYRRSPLPSDLPALILDEKAAGLVRWLIGTEDEAAPIVLQIGDGHDGRGIYAWLEEYPEEGSIMIASLTK